MFVGVVDRERCTRALYLGCTFTGSSDWVRSRSRSWLPSSAATREALSDAPKEIADGIVEVADPFAELTGPSQPQLQSPSSLIFRLACFALLCCCLACFDFVPSFADLCFPQAGFLFFTRPLFFAQSSPVCLLFVHPSPCFGAPTPNGIFKGPPLFFSSVFQPSTTKEKKTIKLKVIKAFSVTKNEDRG